MWVFEPLLTLLSAGVSVSSTKVAELLVSHFYWSNNVPIAWKFLETCSIKGLRRNGKVALYLLHSGYAPLSVLTKSRTEVLPFRFDAISDVDVYKVEPWDLPSALIEDPSNSLSLCGGRRREYHQMYCNR
ncbi:hypothetical protein HanIR_Chr06g0285491 [Helianthus annuus]|nr:hypothetical protein HanIR_Chr06g0285491 [Helianthus annuus]